MPTRLLLVRHGESDWNAKGLFQGHARTGLSSLGKEQAAATARHLARAASDASLIVRSDLERVAETAAPTELALGVEVRVDPRLRELDVGTWEGLTWADIERDHAATVAAWRAGEDVRCGGGETFGELRSRVWAALTALAGGDGTVLVFTHGGPIRIAAAAALELPRLGERRLLHVANCAISELLLDDGAAFLVSYNRVGHLDGLRS